MKKAKKKKIIILLQKSLLNSWILGNFWPHKAYFTTTKKRKEKEYSCQKEKIIKLQMFTVEIRDFLKVFIDFWQISSSLDFTIRRRWTTQGLIALQEDKDCQRKKRRI